MEKNALEIVEKFIFAPLMSKNKGCCGIGIS